MRVAIAGTCGLALAMAREIQAKTSHQLIILSRYVRLQPHPLVSKTWRLRPSAKLSADILKHRADLLEQGYQCQVVDYTDTASLQHALLGVDTVISTVTGNAQLRLIEAAAACRVRRFAPAEFEGQPSLRPQGDPLDRGRALALAHLYHYRNHIQYTVFVCGVLYERFSVNGMASHGIGAHTGYGGEGDFIVDVRRMTAEAPVYDSANQQAWICLTSAYDVARFVVRALDLPQWPAEMTMCGDRMPVNTLVETIRACRGKYPGPILALEPTNTLLGRAYTNIEYDNPDTLRYKFTMAQMAADFPRQRKLQTLIATAEGKYDFATPAYLNSRFPNIRPTRFQDWFLNNWQSVP